MKIPEYCGTLTRPRTGLQIQRGSVPRGCKRFLCSRRNSDTLWVLQSLNMNG